MTKYFLPTNDQITHSSKAQLIATECSRSALKHLQFSLAYSKTTNVKSDPEIDEDVDRWNLNT